MTQVTCKVQEAGAGFSSPPGVMLCPVVPSSHSPYAERTMAGMIAYEVMNLNQDGFEVFCLFVFNQPASEIQQCVKSWGACSFLLGT